MKNEKNDGLVGKFFLEFSPDRKTITGNGQVIGREGEYLIVQCFDPTDGSHSYQTIVSREVIASDVWNHPFVRFYPTSEAMRYANHVLRGRPEADFEQNEALRAKLAETNN